MLRHFVSSTCAIPESSAIPQHVAIIMDGNGRWAKKRLMPRVAGHVKGMDAVRTQVRACVERGIKYLTLFAFSSENWRRPSDEISFLMKLFSQVLMNEVSKLAKNQVRLRVIGDMSRFDENIQRLVAEAQEQTAHHDRLHLTIAANYGGRWDILQAVQALQQRYQQDHANLQNQQDQSLNQNAPALISEADFAEHLSMAFAPEPDLFIRTGGEQRISNFLLWQLAYTEIYFTDTLWPDFDAAALDTAIASYQHRERRFGRTSEQIVHASDSPDSTGSG